jgi:hypothetical protein
MIRKLQGGKRQAYFWLISTQGWLVIELLTLLSLGVVTVLFIAGLIYAVISMGKYRRHMETAEQQQGWSQQQLLEVDEQNRRSAKLMDRAENLISRVESLVERLEAKTGAKDEPH